MPGCGKEVWGREGGEVERGRERGRGEVRRGSERVRVRVECCDWSVRKSC